MATCTTPYFQGLGDCQALLSRVIGVGITTKGTTFSATTFIQGSTWQTNIADDEPLMANINTIVLPLKQYERTTDDPEVQTSNLGIKDKTQDPAPSLTGWLDMSACDYKTIHDLEGSKFDIVLFLDDGTQVGTSTSTADTIRGMRGVISTRKDLPPSDNGQSSYPIDIYFRNSSDFKNVYFASPDYTLADLLDYVPVGLNLRITTAYTTGNVVVKVTERGTSDGKTGLSTVTDWEVLASNADPVVAVTAVSDDGLGVYTVTIQKGGTPANLTAGDNYTLICHDGDATNLTYISNVVKETVA